MAYRNMFDSFWKWVSVFSQRVSKISINKVRNLWMGLLTGIFSEFVPFEFVFWVKYLWLVFTILLFFFSGHVVLALLYCLSSSLDHINSFYDGFVVSAFPFRNGALLVKTCSLKYLDAIYCSFVHEKIKNPKGYAVYVSFRLFHFSVV